VNGGEEGDRFAYRQFIDHQDTKKKREIPWCLRDLVVKTKPLYVDNSFSTKTPRHKEEKRNPLVSSSLGGEIPFSRQSKNYSPRRHQDTKKKGKSRGVFVAW
jgi:hypothetical protein